MVGKLPTVKLARVSLGGGGGRASQPQLPAEAYWSGSKCWVTLQLGLLVVAEWLAGALVARCSVKNQAPVQCCTLFACVLLTGSYFGALKVCLLHLSVARVVARACGWCNDDEHL